MAVTITTVLAGADTFIFDVEATADGDTGTGAVAHGLGTAPLMVTLTPLLAAARVSDWIVSAVDATSVTLAKTTAAGGGATGNQVRCVVRRPHSIGM